MAVSNQATATLSTYALGSCVAVTAYDPILRVGGILHLMLPDSKISVEKAAVQPAMFADTGLPFFFRHLAIFRADAGRLRIHLAGGASVIGGIDPFRIGERNVQVTLEILARMGVPVHNADLRGTVNGMVQLEAGDGPADAQDTVPPERSPRSPEREAKSGLKTLAPREQMT